MILAQTQPFSITHLSSRDGCQDCATSPEHNPEALAMESSALRERALSEAPKLSPKLELLKELHGSGVVSSPDVCFCYILLTLGLRYGERFLTGWRRAQKDSCDIPEEPPHFSASICDGRVESLLGTDVLNDRCLDKLGLVRETATLRDFACRARLHRIPDSVSICLEQFYAGRRPLRLIYRIPEPQDLLTMQADGVRCVSVLTSLRLLSQVYGHRDCLDMLLHDFAHMEKFVEAGRYWQQVGFFEFLQSSVSPRHFRHWRSSYGRRWELSWFYISSDMNAVANHMILTLKAQLMVAMARSTLLQAGRLDESAEDAKLESAKSDVYPRASMSHWKPALQHADLLPQFEDRSEMTSCLLQASCAWKMCQILAARSSSHRSGADCSTRMCISLKRSIRASSSRKKDVAFSKHAPRVALLVCYPCEETRKLRNSACGQDRAEKSSCKLPWTHRRIQCVQTCDAQSVPAARASCIT